MVFLTAFVIVVAFLGFWSFILPLLLKDYRFLNHKLVPNDHKNSNTPINHAIVIGGSLGGMLAAKVLSKHATHVTVLERGRIEAGKCIPVHAAQLHTILGKGIQIFEKFFPGIEREIDNHPSGFRIDWGSDMIWHTEGGYRVPFRKGEMKLETTVLHRIFLENMIRKKVQEIPNVTIVDESNVKKFIFDSINPSRVVGVIYEQSGAEKEMRGELVVDCGGQTAPSHHLISSQTGIKLEKSFVKSDLNYVGLDIQVSNLTPKFVYYQPSPPHTTGAALSPGDKDTFSAVLIGINGTAVPKKEEDIDEFLKPFPHIYEIFKKGKVTKILPYKKEGSDYFHYERTGLTGFVALGDAVTSFNPVYGQGQTNTAESALLLDYFLWFRTQEKGWESQFQALVAKKMTIPYLLAGASDIRYKNTTTTGSLKNFAAVADFMFSSLLKAGTREKYVQKTMAMTLHLYDEFLDRIFSPAFLFTMMRGNIRYALGI